MANYQIVGFGGNLTSDVKVHNNKVASFSLAVNSGWGEKKQTAFINCKAFSASFKEGPFKLLSGLTKGINVGIRGEFITESYEKDGQKRSNLNFIVRSFDVYSQRETDTKTEAPVATKQVEVPQEETDDIPF